MHYSAKTVDSSVNYYNYLGICIQKKYAVFCEKPLSQALNKCIFIYIAVFVKSKDADRLIAFSFAFSKKNSQW